MDVAAQRWPPMNPILGAGRSIVHGDLINPDLLNLERRRSNRLDVRPAARSLQPCKSCRRLWWTLVSGQWFKLFPMMRNETP